MHLFEWLFLDAKDLCKRIMGNKFWSTLSYAFALFQFGTNSFLDSEHFRYSLPLLIATQPLCVEVNFQVKYW